MDYKEKYEQALERAKVINPGTADYEVAVKIFPELKESEDEKIRKRLIKIAKTWKDGGYACGNDDEIDNILAWLEKQGVLANPQEQTEPLISGYTRLYRHNYKTPWGAEISEIKHGNIERCVDNLPDHYEYDCSDHKYLGIGTVTIVSVSDVDNIPINTNDPVYEKQGEQKPADKIEPKFKVGDIISDGFSQLTVESVQEDYYIVTTEEIENDAHIVNWVIYFKEQDKWKTCKL